MDPTKNRIGILTGGGDVPGLNSVIKSAVYRASEMGRQVIGIRKGWEGLTHMDPAKDLDPGYLLPLTRESTRTIDRSGGTILHTSRTNPLRIKKSKVPSHLAESELGKLKAANDNFDFTPIVLRNLERLGIGCLIVIGGDDTLSFATVLRDAGMPLIAIPKTMDNDVRGTEYCIGFSTAIARAVAFINRQRTHLGSHEVVGVFRIFGRDSGFTALATAMAVSDLRCVIPEHPFELDRLCEAVAEDQSRHPSRYSMVICSEGAMWKGGKLEEVGPPDAYGHRHKQNVGEALAEEITHRTRLPSRMQDLAHDLRSGDPDPHDKIVANTYGTLAVELIAQGKTGRMVCLQNGLFAHAELPDPALGPRTVDLAADYDIASFRPNFSTLFGRPRFL
jgi:6-phosphofructokinase 1